MKITYDAMPPVLFKQRKRSREYFKIQEFLTSDYTSMMFEYQDAKEARQRRQSLAITIKREGIPVRLQVTKNQLYVIKKEEQ